MTYLNFTALYAFIFSAWIVVFVSSCIYLLSLVPADKLLSQILCLLIISSI